MRTMEPNELRLEIVTSSARFFELEAHWKLLYSQSGSTSIALSWEWQSSWWRIFGAGRRTCRLRLLVAWRGGEAAALLPLYEEPTLAGGRRLRFISCTAPGRESIFPEYLDVLCRPDCATEACLAFESLLGARRRLPWQILMFERFASDSHAARLLRRVQGFPNMLRLSQLPSPQADLSGGFDAYLMRRSSSARSRFRRLLRAFEENKLSFSTAQDADQAHDYFSELVTLHQQRWAAEDQPGAFSSSRVQLFHRTLLTRLAAGGEALIARLADSAGPLALIYGFVVGGKFDFYQSGVCGEPERCSSPGILAHLLTMRHLAARGVQTYDFLGGESDYKSKLATRSAVLMSASVYRPAIGSAAAVSHSLLRRIALPALPRLRSVRNLPDRGEV